MIEYDPDTQQQLRQSIVQQELEIERLEYKLNSIRTRKMGRSTRKDHRQREEVGDSLRGLRMHIERLKGRLGYMIIQWEKQAGENSPEHARSTPNSPDLIQLRNLDTETNHLGPETQDRITKAVEMVKTSINTIQTQLRTMKPPDPDKKRSNYARKHQKLTNELHQLIKIRQQQEENLDQVLLQWHERGSKKGTIRDSTSGSDDSQDQFMTNEDTYETPRTNDSSSAKGSMESQDTVDITDIMRDETAEGTWTSAITRKHHRREMENITKLNKHIDIILKAARKPEQTGHPPRRYEDLINEGRCLTCDVAHDQCPWGHRMDIISLQHLHKLTTTTYQQAKEEGDDAKEAIIRVMEMYWKYVMTMNQVIRGRRPFHHRSSQPLRMI